MTLAMFDNLNAQAYDSRTAPHWAVGFSSLLGATKVASIATFLSSALVILWRVGRGSRKACRCSIGLLTPFRPATPFSSWLVGFNLLTGANTMQKTPIDRNTASMLNDFIGVNLQETLERVSVAVLDFGHLSETAHHTEMHASGLFRITNIIHSALCFELDQLDSGDQK